MLSDIWVLWTNVTKFMFIISPIGSLFLLNIKNMVLSLLFSGIVFLI